MRAPQALKHLIGIYQAERDWGKAIENATRFEEATGEPMGKLVAQFECELADAIAHRARTKPRAPPSRAHTKPMRTPCARGILEGRIELEPATTARDPRLRTRGAHRPGLPARNPPAIAAVLRPRRRHARRRAASSAK
jgi:lipopolysaccharide biosynthesis regulator YciM